MIDFHTPFVMREDLYAYDGTLIVSQGEIINARIIEEIQLKSPSNPSKKLLLKETELFDDIFGVLNETNFQVIFNTEESKNTILDVVKEINLTPEIVKELEFFKIKDFYTYRHVLITTAMTVRMVMDLFADVEMVKNAASTALTHDFGKSRIPLNILQSSKKLDYEEFTYIQEHPWIGFLLLTYYTGHAESHHSLVSFNHHEKNDGSGYPRGICVDDPITQLITINDMFDALISHRPYRMEPFNIRGALDYLCDEAEMKRLNMKGVKLLISYNRKNNTPPDSIIYSHDHLGYRPPDELNHYSSHEDFEEPDFDDHSGTSN